MRYYGENQLHRVDPTREETFNTNPYPPGFEKVNIPEGESGDSKVERYTVTDASLGLFNLRIIRDGRPERVLPPGTYTRLLQSGRTVMSDTPAEGWEHADALRRARGHVLINGLGLGFYLAAILRKPEVTKVTVVEYSEHVLKLVAPSYENERVEFIQADALTWQSPRAVRYGFIWHDIWADINEDNKPEMTKLKRKFGRRCDDQACWSQEYL